MKKSIFITYNKLFSFKLIFKAIVNVNNHVLYNTCLIYDRLNIDYKKLL